MNHESPRGIFEPPKTYEWCVLLWCVTIWVPENHGETSPRPPGGIASFRRITNRTPGNRPNSHMRGCRICRVNNDAKQISTLASERAQRALVALVHVHAPCAHSCHAVAYYVAVEPLQLQDGWTKAPPQQPAPQSAACRRHQRRHIYHCAAW